MKVLAVGTNLKLDLDPEIEAVQCDIRNLPEGENEFDIIYCMNSLPMVERAEVPPILERFKQLIKPYGEVQIMIPNAEFAAKQIFIYASLTDPMEQLLPYTMLYGNSLFPFRACYPMAALRGLVEQAGMLVRSAENSIMETVDPTGKRKIGMPMFTIIGTKNE